MKTFIIQLPYFYSYQDEDYLFLWLKNLNAVKNFRGTSEGLEITCPNRLNKSDLRDLIAWATRYGINKKFLVDYCTPSNKDWFRNPIAYWHSDIFE